MAGERLTDVLPIVIILGSLRETRHIKRTMFSLRQFVDFYVFGRHRLETIAILPLGLAIADAFQLYGEPTEAVPCEDSPDISEYTFNVGAYHQAVISVWDETVRSITYWSAKSDRVSVSIVGRKSEIW